MSTCYCDAPTREGYAYCEQHRQEHSVQWREEHSRVAACGTVRTSKEWMIGDACQVILRKITYQARILDMSDRADGTYLWTQLELTKCVPGFDGSSITQTWIHPEPVQSYKLKKVYIK